MRKKITYLMVIRNILAEERYFRQQAVDVTKSKKRWERGMKKTYLADADDYKKLAELVRAKKWKEAFQFWENLDTFVRDGVPGKHAEWILNRAVAAFQRKNRKKVVQ